MSALLSVMSEKKEQRKISQETVSSGQCVQQS